MQPLVALLAPYPYKGTLTSRQAAEAMSAALHNLHPQLLPLGDGGSGTLDALAATLHTAACRDTRRRVHTCRWATTDSGDAIVEAAEVIVLANDDRDPAHMSTEGLGTLIITAHEAATRQLIVGLGDTATHDCGLGIGAALGYRFLDADGRRLEPIGASLAVLAAIDPAGARSLDGASIVAYCDVLNPLLGSDGAALKFASQKGASPEMVERLEEGGRRFAEIVRRDLGLNVADIPGAGAAGGLGAGLATFCGAALTGGADAVLEAVRFDERATKCGLVITGEGRLDSKTLLGKGVGNVARRTSRLGVRTLVIAGSIEGTVEEWERKLDAMVVVLDATSEDAAARVTRCVAEAYARLSGGG